MTCKECNCPTTLTPEEAEVCMNCGLLQDPFFPIISMEVERYITARGEYHSTDDYSTAESFGGSFIRGCDFASQKENEFIDRSALLTQQKQQNSSKSMRISRLAANIKAICYKHFNESISKEAINLLTQIEKENQCRNIKKYHLFGACIYFACKKLSFLRSFSDIASAINDASNANVTSYNEIGKVVKKITFLTEVPKQVVINHPSTSPINSTAKAQENQSITNSSNNEDVTKRNSMVNKSQAATIEGIMNKHYASLKIEYSILQKAILLVPKYLDELQGRKPTTIAAVCFLKASSNLSIQSVTKVLGVSRPTLSSALKLV